MQSSVDCRRYGIAIFWCCLLLTLFGILLIFTSSSINAVQTYGDIFHFPKRQSLASFMGMIAILIILRTPFKLIERLSFLIFLATSLLLLATLVPGLGHSVNGASRWIRLASMNFQPAELAKLSLILFMARNLTRKSAAGLSNLKSILPNLLPFIVFGSLLMLQPDFGSTFLLGLISFLMLFVAGLPWRYIALTTTLSLFGIVLAIWQAPYRLARLTSFIDPWASAQTGGFQIIQSYLSFFNGSFLGMGLGESRQKLYFLPEAHTDFILSVIGEELGFLGVSLIIFTYAFLTYSGFLVTKSQKNSYRKFLAFGLTALIAIQACINMGVAMGLLPTKGMPLPFISHGSSSLLVFLTTAGLLAKIALETENSNAKVPRPQ